MMIRIWCDLIITFFHHFIEKLLVQPDPGLYSMINQGVLTVDGIDDCEEMKITDDAFDVLGFTPEEKLSLYKGMLSWNQVTEWILIVSYSWILILYYVLS